MGVADRTDYDLNRHMDFSGQDLTYFDPETNEKYIPYCIEPSMGLDRLFLMVAVDAYDEEELANGDKRVVMHLKPALAPYKVAVLPLSKKLNEGALEIANSLNKHFSICYDETGSIGKRYRRQDEIGTPYCICVDFQTAEDHMVTVRDRDSMEQERIAIADLKVYLENKIGE